MTQTVSIPIYVLVIVYGSLGLVMIWQTLFYFYETRRYRADIQELRNRLMAKDLGEFAGATRVMSAPVVKKKDNVDDWTEEEKEQAYDRIPIN